MYTYLDISIFKATFLIIKKFILKIFTTIQTKKHDKKEELVKNEAKDNSKTEWAKLG